MGCQPNAFFNAVDALSSAGEGWGFPGWKQGLRFDLPGAYGHVAAISSAAEVNNLNGKSPGQVLGLYLRKDRCCQLFARLQGGLLTVFPGPAARPATCLPNGEKGACSLKMTSWRSNTLALCVCNPSKRHPAGCPSTAYLPWARALPGRMRAFPGVPRQARAKAWGPVRQEGYVCSTRGSSSRSGVVAVGNAAGQAVITELLLKRHRQELPSPRTVGKMPRQAPASC